MEGESAQSLKVWIHYFFPSALHGQPLALDPTPTTSQSTVALKMELSRLQGPSGNLKKRNPLAYAGNSTMSRLNPIPGTISIELSWLPYEDFISIAYFKTDNSELIELQKKYSQFHFLACTNKTRALVVIPEN